MIREVENELSLILCLCQVLLLSPLRKHHNWPAGMENMTSFSSLKNLNLWTKNTRSGLAVKQSAMQWLSHLTDLERLAGSYLQCHCVQKRNQLKSVTSSSSWVLAMILHVPSSVQSYAKKLCTRSLHVTAHTEKADSIRVWWQTLQHN